MKALYLICLFLVTSYGVGYARADGFNAHSIRKAGDTLQVAIPLGAMAASVFFENDHDGTKQFLGAFMTTTLATHVLKNVTNKLRPDGSDRRSFPSGHTSSAFAGAAFIHRRYGFDYALPAYVAASFVGYSRVRAKKHDPVDVVAGAALGIATMFVLVDPWDDRGWQAAITQGSIGLRYGLKF